MSTNQWIMLDSKLYIRSFLSPPMSTPALQWHFKYDANGNYPCFKKARDMALFGVYRG